MNVISSLIENNIIQKIFPHENIVFTFHTMVSYTNCSAMMRVGKIINPRHDPKHLWVKISFSFLESIKIAMVSEILHCNKIHIDTVVLKFILIYINLV